MARKVAVLIVLGAMLIASAAVVKTGFDIAPGLGWRSAPADKQTWEKTSVAAWSNQKFWQECDGILVDVASLKKPVVDGGRCEYIERRDER